MGLESYFFQLLPDGVKPTKVNGYNAFVGKSHIKALAFIEKFKEIYSIKAEKGGKYSIEEVLYMTVGNQDDWLQEISFEGCFAWYEEGLDLSYEIAKKINSNIIKIKVFNPAISEFDLNSKDEFVNKLKGIFESRHKAFVEEFGEIHVKVLPDNAFCDFWIKSRKKKGLFSRLFR